MTQQVTIPLRTWLIAGTSSAALWGLLIVGIVRLVRG
jgi:hypothetical protein